MARDTRASASAPTVPLLPASDSATPSKRKRKPSPPATTDGTTLKVVLPSPSSLSKSTAAASPSKVETGAVGGQQDAKRQKISLKVSNGRSAPAAIVDEEALAKAVEEGGHLLSRDTRGALAVVISQMAEALPPPLNNILGIWLPPDFVQKEENTLGFVLKQNHLSWERLVDILHVFAENLLVPCSYPNPMPSLAQFGTTVPPLPSHYRSHAIYTFCEGLHILMKQLQPTPLPGQAERWALVQKIPSSGALNGSSSTEWFTSVADARAVEGLSEEKKVEKSLLESMAAGGDKFGLAHAVSVQTTIGASGSGRPVPKLSEVVIRKASLKMARWKELREARKGNFGSVQRGVRAVPASTTSWTPSFAPTYDSAYASGGASYYTTLEAMHQKARYREWNKRVNQRTEAKASWQGIYDVPEGASSLDKGKAKEVDNVLADNAALLAELHGWQEVRIRRGQAAVTERESQIADVLLASLSQLTENVRPADLVSTKTGLAHDLAQRFIPTPGPVIRGTLDVKRPAAFHDNVTVRSRPPVQHTTAPVVPSLVKTPSGYMPSPQTATANPAYRYTPSQTPTSRPYSYKPNPPTGYNNVYTPPPQNTVYNRPSSGSPYIPQQMHRPPGPPVPSNLRQSYAPSPGGMQYPPNVFGYGSPR